ncbi:MAG: hypothetical protein CFE34_18355 [Rhodobacteraceae bacterium PARR1]|nr:MAG: hypothetical protein CFE34_18355 [Rhodobacteraceae bacterium PARR1]
MSQGKPGPSPLTITVTERARALLAGMPSPDVLNATLRLMAKWRAQVLANTLRARSGTTVLSGPFQGMRYDVAASEGAWAARLLGGYEASLAPVLETVIARGYPQILDIGCAEGYYAIGLARRMPQARVYAHDINPAARALAAQSAVANGVADRVILGGAFGHPDFDLCQRARTFVLCDIEGAEDALLDPVAAPGLLSADILVEVHEGMKPGLMDRLAARFAPTHRVTRIGRRISGDSLPDWTESLGDLDRLLLLWEWRSSPTPWLWLERKEADA